MNNVSFCQGGCLVADVTTIIGGLPVGVGCRVALGTEHWGTRSDRSGTARGPATSQHWQVHERSRSGVPAPRRPSLVGT